MEIDQYNEELKMELILQPNILLQIENSFHFFVTAINEILSFIYQSTMAGFKGIGMW